MFPPSLLVALLGAFLIQHGSASGQLPSPSHIFSPAAAAGKDEGPWAQAHASARALVSQMTLEEKVNITRGFPAPNACAGNTGSVPRLQWPGMCLHDAGNGVRAADMVSSYASGIHVGASWDRDLAQRRAHFMAKEAKAKGVNILLGPNAGPLGRIPLGGRNWEGFSVDPYLSGQLNAETVVGYQDAGVIANVKHLIGNEQETHRRPYFGVEAASSNIDDKTLHEYYLWPFMDAVQAGVASVMCSYNRVNGTYACENDQLLKGILKTELGFEGFVMLDWNAQHNLHSATAGLDMLMPMGGNWGQNLTNAVLNGTVQETRVTDMATRIIAAWYLVGQDSDFPLPGKGMQNLTQPHHLTEGRIRESQATILEGAVAGHVLLKNTANALPLHSPQMLSVFGYDATVPDTKNVGVLFELGYESSPEMAQAVLGTEQHFDQAARGGTIVRGGRAGANAPAYMIDPLSALQFRARKDMTFLNWDLTSQEPTVNPASSACLVFINAISTEGWDRDGLRDAKSDKLVTHVASQCSNTIVVIHSVGVRLVDSWIKHPNITGVVLAHLPGQDSGIALEQLLYGEENFSGKLPYTVAKKETDYSPYKPCQPTSKEDTDPQCDFAEGVYLDYRAFDKHFITPRFEFGFGLSYTTFKYTALHMTPLHNLTVVDEDDDDDNNDGDDCLSVPSFSTVSSSSSPPSTLASLFTPVLKVSIHLTNTGPVFGAEVAQLYLSIPNSPPRQLRGFEKVPLKPEQTKKVEFILTRRDLSVWDVKLQKWTIQDGTYKVMIGASSRDIRLDGSLKVAPHGSGRVDGQGNSELL